MAFLCCGSDFVGRVKELGAELAQTMTMCFALALMPLLSWGRYLVEKMREYTSLSVPRSDVDGFVMRGPEVLAHPYVSCSILLLNTVGILWVLWTLVSPWCKRRQLLCEAIQKCALRRLVPGWQCVWKDLGRFLGWASLPIARGFAPDGCALCWVTSWLGG